MLRCRFLNWTAPFLLSISLAVMAQPFPASTGAPLPPSLPHTVARPKNPILFFRSLLAMSQEQRKTALAQRSPEQRKAVLLKLSEYDIMPPEARELRLHQTELRWYVQHLINTPTPDRNQKIELVPEKDRPLVEERLKQWEELSPEIQKEFLENQNAVASYIEHANEFASSSSPLSIGKQNKLNEEIKRWNALPPEQRKRMCYLFRKFFNLSSIEKEKILKSIPDAERKKLERTLSNYASLPINQRNQRITSLSKFASMTPEARQQFLQNAERWDSMSPKEREIWRQLVKALPPLPPLPPKFHLKNIPLPPSVPQTAK